MYVIFAGVETEVFNNEDRQVEDTSDVRQHNVFVSQFILSCKAWIFSVTLSVSKQTVNLL